MMRVHGFSGDSELNGLVLQARTGGGVCGGDVCTGTHRKFREDTNKGAVEC